MSGCTQGAARHCNFTLPMGQTSDTDKLVLHTLVQGLEDAAIAKDVIEKYLTNKLLLDRLTHEKSKSSLRPNKVSKGA